MKTRKCASPWCEVDISLHMPFCAQHMAPGSIAPPGFRLTGRFIANPYARMFAARRMAEAFTMARGARAQVLEVAS